MVRWMKKRGEKMINKVKYTYIFLIDAQCHLLLFRLSIQYHSHTGNIVPKIFASFYHSEKSIFNWKSTDISDLW